MQCLLDIGNHKNLILACYSIVFRPCLGGATLLIHLSGVSFGHTQGQQKIIRENHLV